MKMRAIGGGLVRCQSSIDERAAGFLPAVPRRRHKAGGSPTRRRGFSLIEVVTVMWTLGVALLLGTALLLGSVKMEWAVAASHRRLTSRSALADQFRADVGRAVAAPERLADLTASTTCLLLRLADGRQLVYRWDGEHLERSEQKDANVSRQHLPLGAEPVSVEFITPRVDGRLIILRLSETYGVARVSRQMEISAALGGDIR